jgi:sec-independent protein translocase protein TatA
MVAVTPVAVFSTWQLLLVLLIILILFGSKLPRIARSLGEGITEFKKGLNKGAEDDERPKRLAEPDDRKTASTKRSDADDS